MKNREENLNECRNMALDFFKDKDAINCVDIIIDLYDEIRYSISSEKRSKEKLLRILYNVCNSNSLESLLDEPDIETLTLLVEEFLDIGFQDDKYYIGNKKFAKLNLNECYSILMYIKHSKERENVIMRQLSG